jgi:energy-coupling factor transporter ATP-binding protein EcfA2
MRIRHIHIRDYNQFKDFTLDLSYPADHPTKAGKPLDKVCFIGYSGTGKTSLLKICKAILFEKYIEREMNFSGTMRWGVTDFPVNVENGKRTASPNPNMEVVRDVNQHLDGSTVLISFPQELIIAGDEAVRQIAEYRGDSEIARKPYTLSDKAFVHYDFALGSIREMWEDVLLKLRNYRIEELSRSQRVTQEMAYSEERGTKAFEDYQTWKKVSPNPIKLLAEKLAPFFERFNLQLALDFDFRKEADLWMPQVRTLQGTLIPHEALSTGTKQLLWTILPLTLIDIRNAVVLLDEPETSLFPAVQRTLIDDYVQAFTPFGQLFVATHSPIIAAQFEPCERVILAFNDDGTIRATRGTAPVGADPNVLLYEDFGQTSLLTEQGLKHYERYIELHSLIRFAEDEIQRDVLVNEYLDLANAYKFPKHKIDYKTPVSAA